MVRISVRDTATTDWCTYRPDGEPVCAAIRAALADGESVELSFDGVACLTGSFLNAAVFGLYGEYEQALWAELETRIMPVDISDDHRQTWTGCAERAKAYYRDPERVGGIIREALHIDAEAA